MRDQKYFYSVRKTYTKSELALVPGTDALTSLAHLRDWYAEISNLASLLHRLKRHRSRRL